MSENICFSCLRPVVPLDENTIIFNPPDRCPNVEIYGLCFRVNPFLTHCPICGQRFEGIPIQDIEHPPIKKRKV